MATNRPSTHVMAGRHEHKPVRDPHTPDQVNLTVHRQHRSWPVTDRERATRPPAREQPSERTAMPRSKWFAAAGTAAAITMIMAPATHAASAPSPTAPARAAAVTTLYYDSTRAPGWEAAITAGVASWNANVANVKLAKVRPGTRAEIQIIATNGWPQATLGPVRPGGQGPGRTRQPRGHRGTRQDPHRRPRDRPQPRPAGHQARPVLPADVGLQRRDQLQELGAQRGRTVPGRVRVRGPWSRLAHPGRRTRAGRRALTSAQGEGRAAGQGDPPPGRMPAPVLPRP